MLFAKGFCSSSVRNGPFTVKSFEEGLFFEAEWTTASTSKMVLCYEFLGSDKYYLLSGFERYIIATEAVVPMVVRAAEAETVRIATSKVPENSVIAVAESCGAEEKRAMTLKESATAFVFDYEEATAGERAVCLSTDGEYFVELGKVTAVTLEGLSVDRWVTGLPIAASLVGEIAVSGQLRGGQQSEVRARELRRGGAGGADRGRKAGCGGAVRGERRVQDVPGVPRARRTRTCSARSR